MGLYNSWTGMNSKWKGEVCDEWRGRGKYSAFREWAMQNGYRDGLNLRRIDPGLPYGAGNCEWVTCKDLSQGKRNAVSVICLETLDTFPTAKSAFEILQPNKPVLNGCNIVECCKTTRKVVKGIDMGDERQRWACMGRHWMFADDAFELGILPKRNMAIAEAVIEKLDTTKIDYNRFRRGPHKGSPYRYDVYGISYEDMCRIRSIWRGMRIRCGLASGANEYELDRYARRGITVCDEWAGGDCFQAFLDWSVENGYCDGLEIDRIDNDRGYSPDNCRWVTGSENCRNRRSSRSCVALETLVVFRSLSDAADSLSGEAPKRSDRAISRCCATTRSVAFDTELQGKPRWKHGGLHWITKDDADKLGLLPDNHEAAQALIEAIESHRRSH